MPRLALALLQLLSEYRTGFPVQDREIAMNEEDTTKKMRRRNAGLKAAETKGPEERKREGLINRESASGVVRRLWAWSRQSKVRCT